MGIKTSRKSLQHKPSLPQRALLSKLPGRPIRRGKLIQKPNLARYQHKACDVQNRRHDKHTSEQTLTRAPLSDDSDNESDGDIGSDNRNTSNNKNNSSISYDGNINATNNSNIKANSKSKNYKRLRPCLRNHRPYIPAEIMQKLNKEEENQRQYSTQRPKGRSLYCKPTGHSPSALVQDAQDFMTDVETDDESVESFEMDAKEADRNMEMDTKSLTGDMEDLEIDMHGWRAHSRVCRVRDPMIEYELGEKPRAELDEQPMDDEEDLDMYGTPPLALVKPSNTASRQRSLHNKTTMRRDHTSLSTSPCPSILSIDWSIQQDTPRESIEQSSQQIRREQKRRTRK